mmetsp:Transcript_28243/g.65407  ORF Transcript_28243/g.65407 Transcript_28243/m.65407 type:complete len:363 (-) Transcript_28243:380-1468(-)
MTRFFDKLQSRIARVNSLLCVGLDPHAKELFPDGFDGVAEEDRCEAAFFFCKKLIDATAPHAACFKPNAAFFEALGSSRGMETLKRVMREIPNDIPILLDVKRGDIGSTAAAYAASCFDNLGADAVTLSPLMGWDSISPFVTESYQDKAAFLLCKTSNPGSNDLLALRLQTTTFVYEKIARLAGDWSEEHGASLGLVVGATDPDALANVRRAAGPDVWILTPGVGAQGGDLVDAVRAGLNHHGTGLLIPVSRGISRAKDPQQAARDMKEQIETARQDILNQDDANKTNDTKEESELTNNIESYQKDFIEFSLAQGVLKFGSFVLKSGRTSPYFFNAGLFASGGALFKLGRAYASAIVASKEL